MNKIKKWIIFFISVLVIFILSINIYIYKTHKSLTSAVDQLDEIKTDIVSLDTLKSNIINLQNSQKMFLFSQEESYKTNYSKYLSTVTENVNDLAKDNVITTDSQNNILNLIKDYDSIYQQLSSSQITLPLTSDKQSLLEKSNEIETQLLDSISSSISSNTDSTTASHTALTSSMSSQKKVVQAISSIFTLIIGGPVCFLLNKFKNGDIKLDDIKNTLDKEKQKLFNYVDMIKYNTMINTHNKQMEKEWQDVQTLVEGLIGKFDDLSKQLESIKDVSSNESDKSLSSIKLNLIELKILVKQLPNYHEFIIGLTDSYLNNNK